MRKSLKCIDFVEDLYWDLERDPEDQDLPLRVIDRALNNIKRFDGQLFTALTVADHSVLVSYLCPPDLAKEGLAHDWTEVVVGDVNSAVKAYLAPDIAFYEEAIWRRLLAPAYGLRDPIPESVYEADMRSRILEMDGTALDTLRILDREYDHFSRDSRFLQRAKRLGLVYNKPERP